MNLSFEPALKRTAPKRSESEADNQDALFATLRCAAVADGASQSCFGGVWAQHLVKSFCNTAETFEFKSLKTFGESCRTWLASARTDWQPSPGAGPTPWFLAEAAQQGAYATFLGIAIESRPAGPSEPVHAFAVAVGDACLFRVRAGKKVEAFPLSRSDDFSNSPDLIHSFKPKVLDGDQMKIRRFQVRQGDLLFLATDAVAALLCRAVESHRDNWKKLKRFAEDRPLKWLKRLRARDLIRNDDSTLLVLTLKSPDGAEDHGLA